MKNKALIIVYSSLWIYTVGYGLLFGLNAPLLPSLLDQSADAFALGVFNIMGLFPLYFLVDAYQSMPIKTWKVIFLWLGFLTGAYGITLFFLENDTTVAYTRKKWQEILIGLALMLTLISFFTMTQGHPLLYFNQWTSDSLVGIMSVDFLALYALSLYRLYVNHKQKGWLYAIPLIGYGWFLIKKPSR